MEPSLQTLDVRSRRQWRAWLEKHHASSAGIWFVFYKKHAAKTSIPYEDAVREALCFGWIDSLVKRLDADRFVLKFTPRKPASKWSDSNRHRWAELEAAGALAPAGRTAAPTANRYALRPAIPQLPAYIGRRLKANRKAWSFFQTLSATERRHYVVWIHIAKRPDTREKRLRESVTLLAAHKRLGLK
jgi:uncharacterized protein YdeI (YjbR/CyaY-like superfamily)